MTTERTLDLVCGIIIGICLMIVLWTTTTRTYEAPHNNGQKVQTQPFLPVGEKT